MASQFHINSLLLMENCNGHRKIIRLKITTVIITGKQWIMQLLLPTLKCKRPSELEIRFITNKIRSYLSLYTPKVENGCQKRDKIKNKKNGGRVSLFTCGINWFASSDGNLHSRTVTDFNTCHCRCFFYVCFTTSNLGVHLTSHPCPSFSKMLEQKLLTTRFVRALRALPRDPEAFLYKICNC